MCIFITARSFELTLLELRRRGNEIILHLWVRIIEEYVILWKGETTD